MNKLGEFRKRKGPNQKELAGSIFSLKISQIAFSAVKPNVSFVFP